MESDRQITLLEEARLQAAVLVPVLRAAREKLGKDAADELIGTALRQWAKDLYHRMGAKQSGGAREKWDAAWAEFRPRIGNAVDREMLKDEPGVREYNVTRCAYAELFKALGEPELGTILLCESDFHLADVGGDTVELRRTQTIMKGAAYCDFRYRFNKGQQ